MCLVRHPWSGAPVEQTLYHWAIRIWINPRDVCARFVIKKGGGCLVYVREGREEERDKP